MSPTSATGSPHDSLSVVIVPSADTGQRLLGVVREWYDAGLLAPAVWIRPEDVHVAPGRAPEVTAHHFGEWGVRTADLFEIVGRHRRKLVRVVLAPSEMSVPLYESMGFRPAHDLMRLDLATAPDSSPDT